jgi:hypothetical protein
MATKQRVFSQNNTINYDDYLKHKQGTECLKIIHADNHTKDITINQFVSYDQFMYLSKAFYKQVNTHKCKNEHVTDLYNANISYIQHNQHELKSPLDVCKSPVLYPYGRYKHRQSDNLYFPYKLDMKQLCRERKPCHDVISPHITYDNNQLTTSECNNCNNCTPSKPVNPNKCKTGLCKNAKQLFI